MGNAKSYINPKDLRVLVVDDEEIAAEHARMILNDAGIKAAACSSGKEALHMLEVAHTKMEPYNLVLLDWKMPDMDGMETAKLIRQRYNHETTVIILTAYNWDEIMDEALHIGVEMFKQSPEGYYDAILMDIRMPEMDGLEAAKTIRALPRTEAKSIPIIAMTTAPAYDRKERTCAV